MQKKNGISLIVLVITIIIMVILAGTIIISLNNSGIIQNASEAVDATNLDEVQNLASLIWADAYLDKKDINEQYIMTELAKRGVDNKDNKYEVIVEDNGVTVKIAAEYTLNSYNIKIGDIVNYDSGIANYNGKWKVMGADNGNILLVSSSSIGSLTLSGKDGYVNGIKYLNEKCEPYGKGNGALKARSMNSNDFNTLTGFVPGVTLADTFKAMQEDLEYGNVATYTMNNGVLTFTATNGKTGGGADTNPAITTFTKLSTETLLANGESIKVKCTHYGYNVAANYSDTHADKEFVLNGRLYIDITPAEESVLSMDNWPTGKYWLATQSDMTRTFSASYGIMNVVKQSEGIAITRDAYLFNSGKNDPNNPKTADTSTRDVRAVVYLKSNVELKKAADGTFDII